MNPDSGAKGSFLQYACAAPVVSMRLSTFRMETPNEHVGFDGRVRARLVDHPGPVNIVALSAGARHGLGASLRYAAGATLGFVALFLLIGLGCTRRSRAGRC